MYKAVLNFLRGQVLVHIESGCPERVVNLCAGAEVPFWDVRWLSPVELTLRTTRRGLAQVRQAARQVGAAATVRREQGAPLLARRLRRRYVLLAGLLLTVLLVLEGNFTIWEFRGSGNETVPDEVILRALEDYGITIGTRSLDIDQKDMRSHVLLELKDVVWLAVNVKGCVAQVQVVERVRGQAVVEDRLTNVVARCPGLVTRVEALGGQAMVLPGATVTQGQLLISGVEDTGTFGTRFTAGLGSVEGRTWYTLTANVPLTGAEKRYTGREKRLRSVIFGSRRIKFFANSSIDSGQCDKITERTPVRICGNPLPITWETETLRFYETEPVTVTQARRQKETGAALEAYLHSLVDPYGEVTASQIASRLRGGVLTVTLTAECREELGTQAPIYTANEPDGASG